MKAFELNRHIFAWLCICPATDTSNRLMCQYRAVVTAGIIAIECLAGLVSVIFICKNHSTDFKNCLYAIFQVAALFGVVYMWIIAFMLREKIIGILSMYQQIYDMNQLTLLKPYLNEADVNATRITKFLVIYVSVVFLIILLLMGILNVSHCLLVYGFIDGDRLYFPYQFVLPWNQRTLAGWIALNLFSAAAASFYLIVDYSFVAFFVGICEHNHAFFKSFEASIQLFDESFTANLTRIKGNLVKLIHFHILTRNVFSETAEFYSLFILIQLVCSVIYLSCSIFLFNTIVQEFDLSIGVIFSCVFASASNLFIYCYFGERSTSNFLSYADLLYHSEWFRLSTELQKYIIIMITNAQPPLHYHGFGLAKLNLPTFSGLLRTVLSYCMAFKALTTQ